MTPPAYPLRRLFRVVNGGTPTSDSANWGGDVPWATPSDFGGRLSHITATRRTLTSRGAHSGSAVVPRGSLLVSTRAPIGYVGITGTDMAFNQGCRALVPTRDADVRFFGYQLEARRLDLQSEGLGTTFPELSSEKLAAFPVLAPPVDQQRRIADFLDVETARIDALIAAREHQVRLASTRLEAVAKQGTGRTFVRGTTPLPSGWRVSPLRRAVQSVKTGTTPSSSGPDLWTDGSDQDTLPWYGPSSFGRLMTLGPSEKHLPKSTVTDRVVPLFTRGSVLIIGIGATAGKVAYLDHDATGNQQITALIPGPGVSGRFLSWQLWAATGELRELAPYTTLPIINNDFLKSFPVAVPSGETQLSVAQSLDRAAERVGALQTAASRAFALLRERRQALITAAVTGRFDVSTASGRNVTEGVGV